MIELIAYFSTLIGATTLLYYWLWRKMVEAPYEENYAEWVHKGGREHE